MSTSSVKPSSRHNEQHTTNWQQHLVGNGNPVDVNDDYDDDNNNNSNETAEVDIEFLVVQNNGVKVLYNNNNNHEQHHHDVSRQHCKKKGRVMVATRDFDAANDELLYSVVLSERPALICRANDTADFMYQFVHNTSIDVQCAILDMYHPTPIESTPLGRALAEPAAVLSVLFAEYGYGPPHGAAFIQKLLCIWMMNAHDYFDNMTALFLMGSKINHSCCPNVGYTCRRRRRQDDVDDPDGNNDSGGGGDGILEYRLLKPIAKGEEIVFSYLSDLYETPTLERRSILLESKWFLCQCERCNGPDYCRIMNIMTTTRRAKTDGRRRAISSSSSTCEACHWTSTTSTIITQTATRAIPPRRLPCRYDDDYNPSWTNPDDEDNDEHDTNTTLLVACPKCGARTTSWTCSGSNNSSGDDDDDGNDDTVTTADDANAVLVAREQAMEERLLQFQETMELLIMADPTKIGKNNGKQQQEQEQQEQRLPSVQVLKGVVQEASTMLSPLHYLTLKAQLLYMVACASQKTLQIQYLQQQQQFELQQQQQFELQQAIEEQQQQRSNNNKTMTNNKRGNPKKIKDKINSKNKMNDVTTTANKKTMSSSETMETIFSSSMHHRHPSVYTVAVQGCKAGFALVMAAECIAANCTGCFPGHFLTNYRKQRMEDRKNTDVAHGSIASADADAADAVFRHEPLWDRAVCMLDICTDLCQLPAFCWPWYAVTLTQRYMPILRAKFGASSKQVQEIQKVLIDPWQLVETNDNQHVDNHEDKNTVSIMFCRECKSEQDV